ncbi:DegV family protein [Psychrobacillus sp. NPDC093180]|uniref:DegV family protein n=1 Tax=Psychrobacillus sp. NPDC093180 TaxID=3364489 RepID=UPI0037FCDDFB
MIKILTDSSSDLSNEIIEKYDITVVPLKVNIDGKDYLEGIDLTPQDFFSKLFSSENLPKTSQPSPAAFAEAFSKFGENDELLCLTISSGLSGTYQSACMGKELSGANVTVFDTLAGSLAHGFQIIHAAELAQKGYSVEEIIAELERDREKMNILILLDTLENIVKGGRLSKFQGSLAKILNIKVILEGVNGKVEILEKVQGKKRFQKKTLEVIRHKKEDFSNTIFGITHTGNVEEAEVLKAELIQQFHPKDVVVRYMGATMGTYAGRGGMIISFK